MAVNYTTHLMLDDINLAVEQPYVAEASALAGYVNGRWANFDELVRLYGHTGKYLLSIATTADPKLEAACLDIETGDARIAQAPGWFKPTQEAGKKAKDDRYYPKLYTSIDNGGDLVATLTHAGIKRDEYMLWSAHYTDQAHICGPNSCGAAVQADGTQWTSNYKGVSLDASLCFEYFFEGAPAHKIHKPVPKHKTGPQRHTADGDVSLDQWVVHAKLSLKTTLDQSAASLSDKNLRRFMRYVADGTSSKMPRGLVFWTVH